MVTPRIDDRVRHGQQHFRITHAVLQRHKRGTSTGRSSCANAAPVILDLMRKMTASNTVPLSTLRLSSRLDARRLLNFSDDAQALRVDRPHVFGIGVESSDLSDR